MKIIKTLFIEDESLLRTLFEDSLSVSKEDFPDIDFEMETAADFAEAITKLDTGTMPDVVILDLRLPSGKGLADETPEKEYGFEILKKIKEDPKFSRVPVVVFTNLADRETEHRAYSLGADAFMIKSKVVPHELLDAVVQTIKEAVKKD
jgi:CheY-like chemotaxis protein